MLATPGHRVGDHADALPTRCPGVASTVAALPSTGGEQIAQAHPDRVVALELTQVEAPFLMQDRQGNENQRGVVVRIGDIPCIQISHRI